MKIKFFGAAGTVTGSCYMVDTGNTKFLVDCGMFQGTKKLQERNYGEFPFNPAEADFLLLTHAHIDHSGMIPKLYKKGFKGKVYATEVTKELCSIMLPDSGYIQEMEVERKNRKLKRAGLQLLEPIYTVKDAQKCMKNFVMVGYGRETQITEEIKVRFRDAGHIFGSAMIEIWIGKERPVKMLFSGDIGNINQPIIEDPEKIKEADYVIMESTYGDREHGVEHRIEKRDQIEEVIKITAESGGNLIIPAFAVERTQDLLYHLRRLEQENKLYGMSIVIDSPLAIKATDIYCKFPQYYDEEAQSFGRMEAGCPIIPDSLEIAKEPAESIALNKTKSGKIIISASGMAEAGRIKHHLKHNLWREECSILFVGYQAPATLGNRILNGAKKVRIHGEEVQVNAKIFSLKGFSAHADLSGLLEWVKGFKDNPSTIFITHGEPQSAENLAKKIEERFGINTYIPNHLEELDIEHISLEKVVDINQVWKLYAELQEALSQLVQKGVQSKSYKEVSDKLTAMLKEISNCKQKSN